jgi:hypothetical protein
VDFTFNVGKTESHPVRFRYSRLINTVRIDVDGQLVKRDIFWGWIPAHRHYGFQVGRNEQHEVAIDATFPRLAAKFFSPACRITVDGEFVREY